MTDAKAAEIVAAAKFPADIADQVADVLQKLWTVFINEDALLVEVNPLVKTGDGKIVALDGKVSLDENADFRQPDHEALEDKAAANPLEAAAKAKGLNYVKLDGEVGIIGNGAGLVMTTLDVVAYAGEEHGGVKPANFLDIGGGASAEVMANGLEIILGDPDVKSVFVNVFGGITACDEVANGIVQALELLGVQGRGASPSRWSCASTATTRSWVARSSPTPTTRWCSVWTPWTARPTRPPSWPRSKGRGHKTTMAIFLTKDSKVIVQGMTGATGMKHTTLMLGDGTNIVGGVNPRKAGTTVDVRAGTRSRSSAPSTRPWRPPAPTSRSSSSRRRSPRTRSSRRSTPRSRSPSSSPRASPCTTPPRSGRSPRPRATRPGSSARTAPA